MKPEAGRDAAAPRGTAGRPLLPRRRLLAGLGAAAVTAGCGTAGGARSPFDGGGRSGPPRVAAPADVAPMPGAPGVRLARRDDSSAEGWVETALGPVPFAASGLRGGAIAETPAVFLGGDRKGWDADRMLPLWDRQARRAFEAAELAAPRITLARVWAGDPGWWRQPGEWRMAAEAMARLGDAFGFREADLLGHSSGGTVAFALAQETDRVRMLVGAAPPLAVVAWNSSGPLAPAPEVFAQYDPIRRIDRFAARRAAIVADPRDSVTPPEAWRPYYDRARALGLPVAYVAAVGAGPDRHGVLWPAAETLKALREMERA